MLSMLLVIMGWLVFTWVVLPETTCMTSDICKSVDAGATAVELLLNMDNE